METEMERERQRKGGRRRNRTGEEEGRREGGRSEKRKFRRSPSSASMQEGLFGGCAGLSGPLSSSAFPTLGLKDPLPEDQAKGMSRDWDVTEVLL